MTNPLDLAGRQFLTFYAFTAAVTLGLLYVARSAGDGGDPPRIDTSDPYLIACLRGGKNEALRVATVALIDRGVLDANPSERTVTTRLKDAKVRRRGASPPSGSCPTRRGGGRGAGGWAWPCWSSSGCRSPSSWWPSGAGAGTSAS